MDTTSTISIQLFLRVVIWPLIDVDIPQLSSYGIQFDRNCFRRINSLKSKSIHCPISLLFDATTLESHIKTHH